MAPTCTALICFKANLSCANLKAANLAGSNLLAANLEGAKLKNAKWDKNCISINERQADAALKAGDRKNALRKYKEAEEIYRNIKICNRSQGCGMGELPFFIVKWWYSANRCHRFLFGACGPSLSI